MSLWVCLSQYLLVYMLSDHEQGLIKVKAQEIMQHLEGYEGVALRLLGAVEKVSTYICTRHLVAIRVGG